MNSVQHTSYSKVKCKLNNILNNLFTSSAFPLYYEDARNLKTISLDTKSIHPACTGNLGRCPTIVLWLKTATIKRSFELDGSLWHFRSSPTAASQTYLHV